MGKQAREQVTAQIWHLLSRLITILDMRPELSIGVHAWHAGSASAPPKTAKFYWWVAACLAWQSLNRRASSVSCRRDQWRKLPSPTAYGQSCLSLAALALERFLSVGNIYDIGGVVNQLFSWPTSQVLTCWNGACRRCCKQVPEGPGKEAVWEKTLRPAFGLLCF